MATRKNAGSLISMLSLDDILSQSELTTLLSEIVLIHTSSISETQVEWIWMCILVQSQYATAYDFTECEWGKQRSALALGGV